MRCDPYNFSAERPIAGRVPERTGVITVLTAVLLAAMIGFLALGIEIGYVGYEKQCMQNASDAAALAAAMEITNAIEEADGDVGDAAAYAIEAARNKAVAVAALNDQFVDGSLDVTFGRRVLNDEGNFTINWGESPANVVKVTCRKDNPDSSQPDGRVQTFFARISGNSAPDLITTSVATVESRDIVSVLDFSRSMNFDSYFNSEASTMPSESQVRDNLDKVWDDLGNPAYGNMPWEPDWVTIPSTTWDNNLTVRWQSTSVVVTASSNLQSVKLIYSDGNSQVFPTSVNSGTWAGIAPHNGKRIVRCECRIGPTTWETFNFYDNAHIKRGLGLTNVAYPWPSGSWDEYISMARDTNGSFYDEQIANFGFRRKFGIMTFFQYVMRFRCSHSATPILWSTRHYPFHSLKEGQELLCEHLEELNFNDYIGMVSYDQNHRIEQILNETGMPAVDISAKPLTNDYQAVRDLIHYKQAGHYSSSTNISGGLKDAKQLLSTHGRPGAQPTILLITDGNANTADAGESSTLPAGWDWNKLFDYDGDGSADYTTSSSNARHVLKKAKECVDAGYTIHTMSVGADADKKLMKAVAHLGDGVYINVPAAATTEEMHQQVLDAFKKIASLVPPARLLNPNAN